MGDRPVVADGPIAIAVQTATPCNMKCTVCPHSDVYRSKWFMADHTWKQVISGIKEIPSLVYVTLTQNNEPLLDPSIFDKIRTVREETGKQTVIITNGIALKDADVRRKLKDAEPSRVDISLIGGNKDDYEAITGKSFYDTVNTIKLCMHECLPVQVLVAKTDRTDVRCILSMFDGIPVQFNPLTSNAGLTPHSLYSIPFRHQLGSNCPRPLYFITVRFDGDVVLCCFDWLGKGTLGNVNFRSLREIYYGPEASRFRKEMASGIYSLGMCKVCAKEFGYDIKA